MAVAAPSAKRSRTPSSPPPASASTDAAQDAPPPPAPPAAEADESAPRDYDVPVRPRMAIPNDYERDDDKVEGGGGVNRPPAPGRQDQIGTLNPSVAGVLSVPYPPMCRTI